MEKTEQCPNWKCVNEALIFTIPNEEWHKFHVGVKVLEVKRSETFFSPWCEKKLDSCSSVRLPKVCFSLALSEKKKSQLMIYLFLFILFVFFSFFSWQIPFHRRIIAVFLKTLGVDGWRNVWRRSGWKRRGTAPLERLLVVLES